MTAVDKWLFKLWNAILIRRVHIFAKHNSEVSSEAHREFDRPKTKVLAQRAAAAITIGFSRRVVI